MISSKLKMIVGVTVVLLVLALAAALRIAMDAHAKYKYEKALNDQWTEKVAQLEQERDAWERTRTRLQRQSQQRRAEYDRLLRRYRNVSQTTEAFLAIAVPDDLIAILRESDAAALRLHTATTARPVTADAIAAAYQSLNNRRVYENREEYRHALDACNADKRAVFDMYYGE